MALKQDGSLWAWGYNGNYGLGDGTSISHFVPTRIGTATDWQSVSASSHTVAVKADGSLWGWGENSWGQLGVSNQTASSFRVPTRIGVSTNWLRASAGYDFTVAIQKDGSLWSCGIGYQGQLGQGAFYGQSNIARIGTASDWQDVTAGIEHVIGVRRDGSVWAWGSNYYGQVGSSDLTIRYFSIPHPVASTTWLSISGGPDHSVAVRQDGTLWTWGANQYGQLGSGSVGGQLAALTRIGTSTNWKSVSANSMITMGIQQDGSLWVWGSNTFYGQMGIPNSQALVPTRIGTASWQNVSLGAEHTVALQQNGSLWAWGKNYNGQLGDSSFTYRDAPTRVGGSANWQQISAGQAHTIALQNDGTLWAWGQNNSGELGTGNYYSSYVPVRIGVASNWVSISAGSHRSFGVRQDGTLWAWGGNNAGQLGDSTIISRNVPTRIGTGTNWQSVSAALDYNGSDYNSSVLDSYVLAVQKDGSLWAWGR